MNRGRGFTLVELIVVIAVIAILATLATLGVTRYIADGRDTQRSANATTISEALEKYYDQNGEYPSCSAVTAAPATVSSTTLKNISQSALQVPGASGSTNSITCGTVLAMSGTDFFEYVGDGSPDCTGAGSCLTYTIRYRSEGDGQIKEIKSRREANIATSGAVKDLSTSNLSYKTLSLGWTPVQNTLSYTVEWSTSNTFTPLIGTATSPSASFSVTGLNQGVPYFFRVKPVGGSQQGSWSNIATATPLTLGLPVVSFGAATGTSIQVNWTAAENADSNTRYILERATNSTFTANLVASSATTALGQNVTGLTAGTTYFFRVKARTTTTSPAYEVISAAQSSAVKPNAPSGVTATTNSSTQITVTWSAVSGATGYIVRYGTTPTTITTATTTTTALTIPVTGLLQGQPYHFQAYAIQGSTESNPSATATATTTIDAPAAHNMSGWVDSGQSLYGSSPVNCPAGTTANFYWSLNGGFWQSGTGLRTAGIWLNYGQGATIQVATRCEKGAVLSNWTWSNNSASYTRPGMNFSMWTGGDGCAGGFCGREVLASWNNICGTGAPRIYARQLSAYGNWQADSASNDHIRWKGGPGGGVRVDYYDVNIGCTAASGAVMVVSAYRCTGC